AEKLAGLRTDWYSEYRPTFEEYCEYADDMNECLKDYEEIVIPMYSFGEIHVILIIDKAGSILGARTRMIYYNGTDDGDDDTYVLDYYDANIKQFDELEYNE